MNEKQQAESLFLNSEKSQKEIAQYLGIDPKTLYRWIKEGHWQQLKSATRRMPSVLVENIYEQLDDLNYNISQRERGQRHPTKDESLTINRLTNCINKIQKQTSQGQNIQFMMNFIDYVRPLNDDLAKLLTHYGSAFLNGSQIKGFHPYDIEYGEQTTGSHSTSLSFGEGRGEASLAPDYNPNQLELPFPDQNICDTTTSPSERPGEVSSSIGHESGIEKNDENPTQPTENQSEQPQTPAPKMPEMPENNFPENRACAEGEQEAPPLFLGEVPEGRRGQLAQEEIPPLMADSPALSAGGDGPETTNVVSDQGDVGTMTDTPALNETTDDEDTPDFSDPNLMIKAWMREKGIPIPEDTQLFSIGEKIFSMRVDNKKKKR